MRYITRAGTYYTSIRAGRDLSTCATMPPRARYRALQEIGSLLFHLSFIVVFLLLLVEVAGRRTLPSKSFA